MVLKISQRGDIAPFMVMEVMSAAAAYERRHGHAALHLEVGQPGTAAPLRVREAAHHALDHTVGGYTLPRGMWPLRERIARYYDETYGVFVDPERVMITTGSSAGFLLSFLACFEPGDRIAMVDPGYPAYRNILKALGYTAVGIPAGPDTGFQPTAALLEQSGQDFDGLIVASPSNPTGSMLGAVALADLSEWCQDRSIRLISDEIYHGITYGAPAVTMAAFNDEAVIVNSFSKYFSMTGWRLGWLVLPPTVAAHVERLAQNLFISPPTLSQEAALAAFDALEELDGHVARYAQNRAILLAALCDVGITDIAPSEGAFYLYCNIGHLTDDSVAFCQKLLAETGIAITAGVDFDPKLGQKTVRFSFAGATEVIQDAAQRLREWVPRYRESPP